MAVRSGEKTGVSNGESMPASQDPRRRSLMLGDDADRGAGERRPEEKNTRKFRRGGELTAMGFIGPLSKFLVARASNSFPGLIF